MPNEETLTDEIYKNELSLLHADHVKDDSLLESLLALEFVEISPLGTVIDRQEVVRWLQQKDPLCRWRFEDFAVKELKPGLAHAQYWAKQLEPVVSQSKGSLHSSIWIFNMDIKVWQMTFHQSTKVV